MSDVYKIIPRDEAEPYGLAKGSHAQMYAKIMELIGELKHEEMLKVKVTSTGMQARIKRQIQKEYPKSFKKLELFGLQEGEQRYLHIRYKAKVN